MAVTVVYSYMAYSRFINILLEFIPKAWTHQKTTTRTHEQKIMDGNFLWSIQTVGKRIRRAINERKEWVCKNSFELFTSS